LPWFTRGDTLFFFSLCLGGLVAAVLGFLVGLPSLRLRGDYLAIVTLGFGEIVRVMITQTGPVLTPTRLNDEGHPLHGQMVLLLGYADNEPVYTAVSDVPLSEAITGAGGALGFSGLPTYTSLFWVYLVVGVTVLVAYRLKTSTFGRAFLSIREDEIASEAMGVNTTRYKVWAFVISAFFAGVAGGLFAHTLGVGLSPQAAGFQKSFDIIIMVVLGGMGSISGAVLASAFVTLLPEYLRDPPAVWPLGLAIVIVVVAVQAITRRWKARPLALVIGATLVVQAMLWLCDRMGIQISDYRMIIFALGLVLIMIFRPQGLLGVRELWDKALWRRWFGRKGARNA
jgi:ABC-type branched-subunit amino acid transport system permease subunit